MLLFLFGCLGARLALSWGVFAVNKKKNVQLRVVLALALAAIALGFFYLYATGSRLEARESSTGKTWWAKWRPLHGALYAMAALMVYKGSRNAWMPLVLDTTVGALLWLAQTQGR